MKKILFDINHPAHVHYFKNCINILHSKGHQIFIVARDRYPVKELLQSLQFEYYDRGKGSSGSIGKIFYMLKTDILYFKLLDDFAPDIIVSFSTPYPHLAGKLKNKINIAFTDTERAVFHKYFTYPFVNSILTPAWFFDDLGKKHIRFNSFMELCYLHKNYFAKNPAIYSFLQLKPNEKYVILRFISWDAHHDIGEKGLSYEIKLKAVREFEKNYKVFITSESELPEIFSPYKIKIPPHLMHDALAYADLYFGESPTMATESALLGTPSICVSSWACSCGNFLELQKYKLVKCFTPAHEKEALQTAVDFLNTDSKIVWQELSDILQTGKIDVTAFMVWFIENYPESAQIMKDDPDYQKRFVS